MNNSRGLWRGKCKYNGEWVEGGYFKTQIAHEVAHCIVPFHLFVNSLLDDEVYQIIPETLGERSGLPDKNGNPIFEGDICVVTAPHANIIKEIGVVRYDERSAMFIIDFRKRMIDFSGSGLVEVIGNIHDNPELLSGK